MRSSVKQSMFVREMREARLRALGYTDRKKAPMTTHTRTEECEFRDSVSAARMEVAGEIAARNMRRKATDAGYEHMVASTYVVTTTMTEKPTDQDFFTATATATFARIVPAESPFMDEKVNLHHGAAATNLAEDPL